MVKIVTLILSILSFVFVLVLAPIVRATEQPPEFSVSFRSTPEPNDKKETSPKDFSEQAENGTTTASLVVSGTAVSFGNKDFDKDGYPHELSIFFDVDSTGKTKYYAVFYINFYGDWFTTDNDKSDVYTIDGYDPEEGIYTDFYFFSGYDPMTMSIKVEIYREDGQLACVYGPDDNTSDIKFESVEYDKKEDPFIATPTPTPTPTPCEPDTISVSPTKIKLAEKTSRDVTVTVTGANGCAVEGETVTTTINLAGQKRISISPSGGETDENGQAVFTIAAKKTGNARVVFNTDSLQASINVKVK